MKTAGIVAEYNPFHNGHQYHIEETRKQTAADYVIAVMSGDFVQRGAPAFLDKYERARAALLGGCDLVLELPVLYSCASAEFFSAGAVTLLHQLGVCDFLSFGSEEGNLSHLNRLTDILTEEPKDYKTALRFHLKSGLSFPAAREKALSEYLSGSGDICPEDFSSFLKGSNNILALEYLKALKKLNSNITPATVLRKTASYHDTELHEEISSASAIRHHLLHNNSISGIEGSVPEATYRSIAAIIEDSRLNLPNLFPDLDALTPYLHSTLLRDNNPELYLDWDKDLANRFKQLPLMTMSFTQIADRLKSRNVTHSRVHRALLHYILGIRKEMFYNQFDRNPVPYARILGFRKESSILLKEINKNGSIPMITKPASIHNLISSEDEWVWDMDLAASRLYQSIQYTTFGRILPSAYERTPVII